MNRPRLISRFDVFFTLAFLASTAYGSQIVNPAASGGGGGGSGGYALQPATVTIQGNVGIDMSTGTVQTEAVISTGIPNLGQVNNISFPNIIRNGGFETWRAGTNGTVTGGIGGCVNVPTNYLDAWTGMFSCGSMTTAGMVRVTSPVKYGTYAFQLTSFNFTSGVYFYVQQSIPNFAEYAGSSVTLSGWMDITLNPSSVNEYMTIDDGVTVSSVSLVTADSIYHFVSVTKFISPSATKLIIRLGQPSQANNQFTVTFDGLSLVRGDVPTDYAPPNYSETMSQIQNDPNGGIIGFPTSGVGVVGDIGESTSSVVSGPAAINATNGVYVNIASIILTAGDWDVSGIPVYQANSGTALGRFSGCLSAFSGNTTTDQVFGDNCFHGTEGALDDLPLAIPAWRVSIAATTTIYLKGQATFSAGTVGLYGRISARRAR